IAFPVTDRGAHPVLDRRAQVLAAVGRDDARLVNHLVLEREPARALDDAAARVVDLGGELLQYAGADAAIVFAAIGRPLGFDAVQLFATGGLRLLTLLRGRLRRW